MLNRIPSPATRLNDHPAADTLTPPVSRALRPARWSIAAALFLTAALAMPQATRALDIHVTAPDGTPIAPYRFLIEIDTTHWTTPGAQVNDSIIMNIHNSYNPVHAAGHSDVPTTTVATDPATRYFVSILPDAGYANSGGPVAPGQDSVTIVCQPTPVPTAQISILCFVDHAPINNVKDDAEIGLGGCKIVLSDALGPVSQDAFGNPLGTLYAANDPTSVTHMGDGVVYTLTQREFDNGMNPHNLKVGEALVKNIPPGKYGIVIVPPRYDDDGVVMEWTQTATIEGTPTVDAWVKANEPRLFVEGFGTGFNHAFFGFVKLGPAHSTYNGQSLDVLPWNAAPPAGATGRVTGQLRFNHFTRPPNTQGRFVGEPVPQGWVALNDPDAVEGRVAVRCDAEGFFQFDNVPPGQYQLVTWDEPLDALFGFNTIDVPAGPGGTGGTLSLGPVLCYRWFGRLECNVFLDRDQDGFRDPGEPGIPEQNVNIRFRDGSIYQAFPTDLEGYAPFDEVFPFFKWLVVEVDYARFKPTGMTAIVDYGGAVNPDQGWAYPSDDKRTPQPQAEINPNTGNNLSRTEAGPVLTQAMHLFLNQNNRIDWGKAPYAPGENGGISGVIGYAVTRAESDPRYAVIDPWEPGIPRVQVNLYTDANGDRVIDDLDDSPGVTLADVDNWPFGWRDDPGAQGPEDVDRNGNGRFDAGDAIQIVTSDSWDDNKPSGCIQALPIVHGSPIPEGADAFGTWNQIRPGVFDGGYAFNDIPAGLYIVEACAPPGYEHVKEEDKNVDFGLEFTPSTLLLPAVCVGDPHLVPDELTLFPGVASIFAGQWRPLPDRKQVHLAGGKNAACDFHLFTAVPKAARAVGFVNNDTGAEFNQGSVNFGEKLAPSWIPISVRDWTGHELTRVYSDEFGGYNFLVPATFTVNAPTPTGVSPNMLTLILNDPIKPDGSLDPWYDPFFTVTPWTFDYMPGKTSYLDTPLVPTGAFTTAERRIDTEAPDGTPGIAYVDGPEAGGGPVLCASRPLSERLVTLHSMGMTWIRNPDYSPTNPVDVLIQRDYGFGAAPGQVTLEGVALTVVGSWTNDAVTVRIPTNAKTGRLMIRRGADRWCELGVTLHIIDCATENVIRVPDDYATIQEAVDAASAGDLVLVGPGTYNENVVVDRPVRLQGAGHGATFINGNPTPVERLQTWHDRINAIGGMELADYLLANPFGEAEAPCILVTGEAEVAGMNVLAGGGATRILMGQPFTTPGEALVDGFTLSGSKQGGGVLALAGARYLTISNNNIMNNQGSYGGGVAVGVPDAGWDAQNDNVTIRDNKIHRCGSTKASAGISMNDYSENYLVENNYIIGNFCTYHGAGFSHRGYSPGTGVVRGNRIVFNENFFGAILAMAGDGGGIYVSGDVIGGTGSGNVTIDGNLIQGNMCGAGSGGGIAAVAVNGVEDVRLNPTTPSNWFELKIVNNIIVNNIAGYRAGGIWLQDCARVTIAHNTIANNDAASVAALAFRAGQSNSTAQPAGVVSSRHSGALEGMFGQGVGQSFSNPDLRDNIIWHNRSFYNNRSLNGGQGGLAPSTRGPYWDLNVIGSTSSGHRHLTPRNCVLSSRIDPVTGRDYGGASSGNVYSSPQFVLEYFNALQSATVLDEGGNNINVRFTPLSQAAGDYHLRNTSPAIGAADSAYVNELLLRVDYDRQLRPTGFADIGADEYYAGGAANAAPIAANDTYTVRRNGSPLVISAPGLLMNDTDANGDTLSVVLPVTPGAGGLHGSLVPLADGRFTYNVDRNYPSNANSTGTVTFTYRVSDGVSQSNLATVTLRITAAGNQPPVGVPDAYETPKNTTLRVPAPGVLGNDVDVAGDTMRAALISSVGHGSLTFRPDGSFDYVPIQGFTGLDSFRYRVSDSASLPSLDTVLVTITVAAPSGPVNRAPQPTAPFIVTMMNNAGMTSIAPNDPDKGNTHTFAIEMPPDVGSAEVSSQGVVTYTPPADTVTTTMLVVRVTDQGGLFGDVAIMVMVTDGMQMPEGIGGIRLQFVPDTDPEDSDEDGNPFNDNVMMHLGAGDGFITMADGRPFYIFGFSDLTTTPADMAMMQGMLAAEYPGPTIKLRQGQKFYLNLTNVGMAMRPDLFDAHSVHYHGFPNAAPVYDGVPDSAIAINMGATLTYFYQIIREGTFMYHCHVEATEHMQMGMLANLYVTPKQDGTPIEYNGKTYTKFAYNDGDGSTGYDVDFPIQIGSFDPRFHDASEGVEPLPFALMRDTYPMLNGRGYPDTVNDDPLPAPMENGGKVSQFISSHIVAHQGDRVLLRLSNLNVTQVYTLSSPNIPFLVVGHDASLLRGPDGASLYYRTHDLTLASGESRDVILETAGVAPGTYVLHTTNLNYLSNDQEDFGGMMTEIEILP